MKIFLETLDLEQPKEETQERIQKTERGGGGKMRKFKCTKCGKTHEEPAKKTYCLDREFKYVFCECGAEFNCNAERIYDFESKTEFDYISFAEVISEMIQHGEYEKAAEAFLSRTNTKISITYLKYGIMQFWKDETPRDIYTISLTRPGAGKYNTKFGQSIHASSKGEKPSAYDFLSCLNKHPDSFSDFCGMLGYDTDSRPSEKIWKACIKEYKGLEKLYTPEELDALREIN